MATFPLKIVTPDGLIFDEQAQMVIVRTVNGDMAVMARHINCAIPLGMGQAVVITEDGQRQTAACIGGMLSVVNGEVSLIPTTFEWSEHIDIDRVLASKARAEEILKSQHSSSTDVVFAEARLKRALVRHDVFRRRYQ